MPSRSTAKVTSTSAKTSTAGASSGSFTREWALLPARLFRLRNRSNSQLSSGRSLLKGQLQQERNYKALVAQLVCYGRITGHLRCKSEDPPATFGDARLTGT